MAWLPERRYVGENLRHFLFCGGEHRARRRATRAGRQATADSGIEISKAKEIISESEKRENGVSVAASAAAKSSITENKNIAAFTRHAALAQTLP